MIEDRWLSAEKVAGYLGDQTDTLCTWVSRKSMPANKVGRPLKFTIIEVEDWIRSGKPNSEPEGENE